MSEDLSDAEAEAVVLALANPLQWKAMHPGEESETWRQSFWANGPGSIQYHINWQTGSIYTATVYDNGIKTSVAPTNGGLDEMKAACERHHATGKW